MAMNEGAVSLAGAMGRRGWSQKDVEVLLGITSGAGYVSLLLHGRRKPSRELAYRMEKELGIAMSSWDTPSDAKPPKKTWGTAV